MGSGKPYIVKGDEHFKHITHVDKRRFLVSLSETGSVFRAAELTGVSRYNHPHWKKTDEEYAEAAELAMFIACDKLEVEARRRAVDGIEDPVFYQGEKVGVVKRYSDNLLQFLMKGAMPEKYKDRILQENVNSPMMQKMEDLKNMSPDKLKKLEQLLEGADESTDN